MAKNPLLLLGVFLIGLGLVACDKNSHTAVDQSPFKLTASIQEIMTFVVDPAADGIWESVTETTTKAGTEIQQPTTDADWKGLRQHAISLAESSNLLAIKGRKIAHEGKALDDAGTPGILAAPDIEKAIAGDWPGFVKAAQELRSTAVGVLAAIDAKDPAAVLTAGGKIEQACEQCHIKFWYPNAKGPQPEHFRKPAGVKAGHS